MEQKKFSKKNKVLFIIHDVYQEDNVFPLGIGYMAAVLHNEGAYTEAYCMDVFHYSNEELAKHLQENEYDLIGVGFMAARFKETIVDLCKVINENKKNAWFILGGFGPTPIPEYMLRKTKADIIALGEAEFTILDLLECKISDGDLSQVKGIAYLENNKLKLTGAHKPVNNLDELPLPLWDIFPMKEYTSCLGLYRQRSEEKIFVMLTSRGCVGKCNFCYRMEKGIRLRSIPKIIEEIKLLYEKYNVTGYHFQDELFLMNKSRLIEFKDALEKENLKIKFSCNARVDIINKELLDILKDIGCVFLNFGFESSDATVLNIINKMVTTQQNLSALKIVKKEGGIGMGLNFLWNNIGDNANILRKNADLIKKYNTYDQCRTIRPVTPYPGCPLYYKLIELGKLKDPEEFFERFTNSDLIFCNVMEMSDKEAYKILHEVNKDLILDHYDNAGENMEEAYKQINLLKDLYEGKITNFRGTRSIFKKESSSLD